MTKLLESLTLSPVVCPLANYGMSTDQGIKGKSLSQLYQSFPTAIKIEIPVF